MPGVLEVGKGYRAAGKAKTWTLIEKQISLSQEIGTNTDLNLNVDKYWEWIFRCVKAKPRRLAGDAKLVL